MKKLLFAIALFISINAFSQKEKIDTTVTGSTPLLTYNDWQEFTQKILSELPEKFTIPIRQFMEQRFQDRIKEYIDSKKKVK